MTVTGPAAERAAEAAQAQAELDAEVEAHKGWGVREILHHLNNRARPHYEQAGAPSPAAVAVLIDQAAGRKAPAPSAEAGQGAEDDQGAEE